MKKLLSILLTLCVLLSCITITALAETDYTLKLTSNNISATATLSFTAASSGQKYYFMLAFYDNEGGLVETAGGLEETTAGLNTDTITKIIPEDAVKAKAFCWTEDLEPLAYDELAVKYSRSIKIFTIGNSFSEDAMQYLYPMLKEGGYEDITLGRLYIGSGTLQMHCDNANSGSTAYEYWKNTDGTWIKNASQSLSYGLKDEEWDIIVMQQGSGSSGMPNTYSPYLDNLITYVNNNKTNPDAQFAWHMTWAYQQDTDHYEFPNYGSNQMTMYEAIVGAVDSQIKTRDFGFIIPAGTAIQNARTSYLGDHLTRDGYHLNYNTGRYIAALTWAKELCGIDAEDITYSPNSEVDKNIAVAKESAKNAALSPFAVTQSEYTDEPPVDMSNYVLLDWEPTVSSFYNSRELGPFEGRHTTLDNSPQFISSRVFTKAELPVGTIIEIADGYQYRPEGWIDKTTLNSATTRPDNCNTPSVTVTEEWWGNFTYRAFNISALNGRNISSELEAVKNAFKIYVPKSAVVEPPVEEVKYELLDWGPIKSAYYNSEKQPSTYLYEGEDNSKYFIASKILTKEDIPVGSIIEIANGYQYRPEGWVNADEKVANRQGNVTTPSVTVTEEWWGNFNYRGFNISKIGAETDITGIFDTVQNIFKIYVPVSSN